MGVRRSLQKLHATAQITDIDTYPILRSNDQHIMDMACSSDEWSDSQLCDINHC